MYSLDINFLNDRAVRPTDVGIQQRGVQDSPRPLYIGVALGVFLPALVIGLWFLLQARNSELARRQSELDNQLTALQAQLQEVDNVNAEVAQIESQNTALATVFDRIKPWSAILQDVRDRVPAGVQLGTIEQQPAPAPQTAAPPPPADPNQPPVAAPEPPPSTIQITGQASTFNDVNDFVLTLQRSPFLNPEQTRLVSAELIDNPTQIQLANQGGGQQSQIQVQLPKVISYTIESTLTDLPASQLMQELERTLAVGLAARIQALRDRGVLQQ